MSTIIWTRHPGVLVGDPGDQGHGERDEEEAGPMLKAAFSPVQRAGTRMLGVRQFLRLHVMPAGS
jgi:hypothetical protein